MSPAFLQAAASYFGINPEQLAGSDWNNADGQLVVAFEFNVSEDDLVGIVERMKVIKADADLVAAQVEVVEPMTTERMCELRGRWNTMQKHERRSIGSFEAYVADQTNKQSHEDMLAASAGRQVVHIDTPEEPEPTNMDAVWLPVLECNEAQKTMYSDMRANPEGSGNLEYLIQWAMLTDEQKQKAQEARP